MRQTGLQGTPWWRGPNDVQEFTTRGLVIYSTRGHGFHGTFQETKYLQLDELSIRQVLSALSSDDQGSFKMPTKKR